ncbi:copper transporter [Nocardioides sp.]|uniref:copper transporter n=1 Tax=Nocardioides sp. TaxID=35761 RepID=UPI003D11CF61
MISFRHHLVSLVAVFLALAVGVVLGGGPLSEVGRTTDDAAETSAAKKQDATATAADGFADDYVTATAPSTLAQTLKGESVVLVTMPGADPEVAKQLGTLVDTAGGEVVGQYAAAPGLVDPGEKSLVDTLGSQLATSLKDANIPADATTYVRMGRLLGLGLATRTPGGSAIDDRATSILESLKGAELLTSTAAPTKRGALVLVVMGEEPSDLEAGGDVVMAGLATGLAQVSQGVVVAGSTGSAADGELAQLREDETLTAAVSTTDSVQTGAGQVTAVLALSAVTDGTIGAFGASGADGPVPVG